jgi:metallo-beta-lactamase family protein
MTLWRGVQYHEKVAIGPFSIEFFDAGHILGSSFIKIEADGKSIVFSGDLGNVPAPLLRPTEDLPEVDYLVMESTYGGRTHAEVHTRRDLLEDAIVQTVKRGGVLMIPAFSMERTQDLLLHIHELAEERRMPNVPVFMDSPLAIKLTTIYEKYASYFDADSLKKMKSGDDLFNFPHLHFALTPEESKEINTVPQPKIIIAGSGMSNGGRILHHERRYLQDPKSCLLIVGYQAAGTLGRKLLDGARSVVLFGEEIPVRCEIRVIHSYSAHADQPRLLEWVKPRVKHLKHVFLVHGEREEGEALLETMHEKFAITPEIPSLGQSVEL